ncbi:uncharacterized protein [Aristolochia californica]|uniref:uncharacterized protein n=1 Tax=Aristolochia californica TaxID=171875 RepID=UPI0035D6F735
MGQNSKEQGRGVCHRKASLSVLSSASLCCNVSCPWMRFSSKPVSSSPGRLENFPPPLTRSLLSSNDRSRSRSRSRRVRSSPMFRRKAIETPEPGSPKVTCMGQIRVRKSRQHTSPRRCRFCSLFSFSSLRKHNWRKLFAFCFQKKVQVREYSPNKDPNPEREAARHGLNKPTKAAALAVAVDEGITVCEPEEDFAAPSPPKNALLLTRCRSDPQRSSVLANQFWGSPVGPESWRGKPEDEEQEEEEKKRDGRRRLSEGDRWLEKIGGSGPVILTRCRSEPGSRTKLGGTILDGNKHGSGRRVLSSCSALIF